MLDERQEIKPYTRTHTHTPHTFCPCSPSGSWPPPGPCGPVRPDTPSTPLSPGGPGIPGGPYSKTQRHREGGRVIERWGQLVSITETQKANSASRQGENKGNTSYYITSI